MGTRGCCGGHGGVRAGRTAGFRLCVPARGEGRGAGMVLEDARGHDKCCPSPRDPIRPQAAMGLHGDPQPWLINGVVWGPGWGFRAEILTWISSARAIGSAQAGQKPVWERGRAWGWGTAPLTGGYGAGMGLGWGCTPILGPPLCPLRPQVRPWGPAPGGTSLPSGLEPSRCKATVPTSRTRQHGDTHGRHGDLSPLPGNKRSRRRLLVPLRRAPGALRSLALIPPPPSLES